MLMWASGVYFFYPETNGRHLEEVDQIFRDSKNIFDPVKKAKNLPTHPSGNLDHPTGKTATQQMDVGDGDSNKSSTRKDSV